jgi:hypothetical protein
LPEEPGGYRFGTPEFLRKIGFECHRLAIELDGDASFIEEF